MPMRIIIDEGQPHEESTVVHTLGEASDWVRDRMWRMNLTGTMAIRYEMVKEEKP